VPSRPSTAGGLEAKYDVRKCRRLGDGQWNVEGGEVEHLGLGLCLEGSGVLS